MIKKYNKAAAEAMAAADAEADAAVPRVAAAEGVAALEDKTRRDAEADLKQ